MNTRNLFLTSSKLLIFSNNFTKIKEESDKFIENISNIFSIILDKTVNGLDAEHKYYILMDFLQSVESDLGKKKYSEQIQKITRVYNDVKSFQKFNKLSDKTVKNMTQDEIEKTHELTTLVDDNEEVHLIIDGTLEVLDSFMEKLNPYLEEIEKSIKYSGISSNAIISGFILSIIFNKSCLFSLSV